MKQQQAAVALLERPALLEPPSKVRYRGWTLPGGLVLDGETPEQAMARELTEETSLRALRATLLYQAPVAKILEPQRGESVHVFRVHDWEGKAREGDDGRPVTWMTTSEFVASCPCSRGRWPLRSGTARGLVRLGSLLCRRAHP